MCGAAAAPRRDSQGCGVVPVSSSQPSRTCQWAVVVVAPPWEGLRVTRRRDWQSEQQQAGQGQGSHACAGYYCHYYYYFYYCSILRAHVRDDATAAQQAGVVVKDAHLWRRLGINDKG